MCGIAGLVQLDGGAVTPETVAAMNATIAHRGPDDNGVWVQGPVGLGNRRLAIIDLSPAGHQPMCNEDGQVVITYSGELYNFRDLRKVLEPAGHRFRSNSDTEVLIHAYEEYGTGCLERFNGHFAFALWDGARKRLLLARDRFGTHPLYYYVDGKRLIFGSEVKAILACRDVPVEMEIRALDEYLTFQNVLTDLTLFRGVRLLPPGCFLALDLTGSELTQERYWDYRFPSEPLAIGKEEAADELFRLFEQAVTRQLMSDVPIGCYLSGGMDSGSITAIARRNLGRLSTFTGGFDLSSASGLELGFDERREAEALAAVLKTEHYEMVMHAGDMEHVMPELIWHLEDLRVGQSYPNYYIARLAGKFVKVVLSGAGGDELFAGYPWRYYSGMKGAGGDAFFRNYYEFWQRLVPDTDKPDLFLPRVSRELDGHSTFEVFKGVVEPAHLPLETNADRVNASLYFELKTFLHGLLVMEDKLAFAHGLETRMPFLDNDLVDFALSLSPTMKLRDLDRMAPRVDEDDVRRYELRSTSEGKLVLRAAMAKAVPGDILARRKQGFSAPDASWFRGESIDYINRLLRSPEARISEYLQPAYVTRCLDEHTAGQINHRLLIWSLLSLEWWLRVFMR
jgi:asparagine synthase (glutamine-hydrolysing)